MTCRRCGAPTRAPLCIPCAIHHHIRIWQARRRDTAKKVRG